MNFLIRRLRDDVTEITAQSNHRACVIADQLPAQPPSSSIEDQPTIVRVGTPQHHSRLNPSHISSTFSNFESGVALSVLPFFPLFESAYQRRLESERTPSGPLLHAAWTPWV